MLLEFEKPIKLLENKLESLEKEYVDTQNSKLLKPIAKLKIEIENLTSEIFNNLTSWQKVQISRHPDRPYTLDYIKGITANFIELFGDRYSSDDPAIVGGFGQIENNTFMLIGQQKGRTTKERQFRRFGMPNPDGYRKALRLMKLAEKFSKPIITFIDTPGAYPGIEAEEKGQSRAIADNLQQMFNLQVPIIVIVIGEGASGGALGIGIGDKIFMLENTWYSIISPESCSTILWKTRDFKEQAAQNLKVTARDMLSMNLIDDIILEPLGGAHKNYNEICLSVKKYILDSIKSLQSKSIDELLISRTNKFCEIGFVK